MVQGPPSSDSENGDYLQEYEFESEGEETLGRSARALFHAADGNYRRKSPCKFLYLTLNLHFSCTSFLAGIHKVFFLSLTKFLTNPPCADLIWSSWAHLVVPQPRDPRRVDLLMQPLRLIQIRFPSQSRHPAPPCYLARSRHPPHMVPTIQHPGLCCAPETGLVSVQSQALGLSLLPLLLYPDALLTANPYALGPSLLPPLLYPGALPLSG